LSKPSDLIPELQGRFPIRVELQSLSVQGLRSHPLMQTHASLVKQYQALLATENVTLDFTDEGITRLAQIAFDVNERTENIGARRLATVMERLLDDVSFDAASLAGQTVCIHAQYVDSRLGELSQNEDLSRYISVTHDWWNRACQLCAGLLQDFEALLSLKTLSPSFRTDFAAYWLQNRF
jgi:ATP-dependent HslUV protease ATP-binding subunit HslU